MTIIILNKVVMHAFFYSFTAALAPNNETSVLMAINFNDTTQPASFELCTDERKYSVSITAPVGELLQPHTMNEKDFLKEQGKRINEDHRLLNTCLQECIYNFA